VTAPNALPSPAIVTAPLVAASTAFGAFIAPAGRRA